MRPAIYRVLAEPWIYRLSQFVLAPGAETRIAKEIRRLLDILPGTGELLDIGCGPASWLRHADCRPIGIDLSLQYMATFRNDGGLGPVASASSLPFADNQFAGVWSVGLLHHLPDNVTHSALTEAMRVCRHGGHVAILDAVLPRKPWLRPLAWAIRRLDRGEFMRTESELHSLLPQRDAWTLKRITYAATGLELLICTFTKPPADHGPSPT